MLPKINQLDKQNPQKSVSQAYLPKYRKVLKPNFRQRSNLKTDYQEDHANVINMIDHMGDMISNRMLEHQNQILQIAALEILQIIQDVKKIVMKFNNMMIQKSKDEDLRKAQNQIDYFHNRCMKFYQENKQLRNQIKLLKKQRQEISFDVNVKAQALSRISYRLAKQKVKNSHDKSKIHEERSKQKQKIVSSIIAKLKKNSLKFSPSYSKLFDDQRIRGRSTQLKSKMTTQIYLPPPQFESKNKYTSLKQIKKVKKNNIFLGIKNSQNITNKEEKEKSLKTKSNIETIDDKQQQINRKKIVEEIKANLLQRTSQNRQSTQLKRSFLYKQ